MSRTWVVIVNYRTADLVVDCLRSLVGEREALSGGGVLVVDNDSCDGSVERLESAIQAEQWQQWVTVLPQSTNGGFAYGNNAGIRVALESAAENDYIMLLNPDTLVRPGAIAALVEFMDGNPRAGIAGSLLENRDGIPECSAHRLHSPISELDTAARVGVVSRVLRRHVVSEPPSFEVHRCGWVSGASMIIRCALFEQVGLLDEGFFLYFEEVDFCARAARHGWEIWHVPQSRVMHLEGAATGIRKAARRRARYWYDSRRRFFVKHYGVPGLLLADTLWLVGRSIFLLRRLLPVRGAERAEQDPRWFAYDLVWGDIRALVTGNAMNARSGI